MHEPWNVEPERRNNLGSGDGDVLGAITARVRVVEVLKQELMKVANEVLRERNAFAQGLLERGDRRREVANLDDVLPRSGLDHAARQDDDRLPTRQPVALRDRRRMHAVVEDIRLEFLEDLARQRAVVVDLPHGVVNLAEEFLRGGAWRKDGDVFVWGLALLSH